MVPGIVSYPAAALMLFDLQTLHSCPPPPGLVTGPCSFRSPPNSPESIHFGSHKFLVHITDHKHALVVPA